MKTIGNFETLYRDVLLQFERQQHAAGKRGPLPCDRQPPELLSHAQRALDRRNAKQREIMSYIGRKEQLTAAQIAHRMGKDTPSISSHLAAMCKQGLITRERADRLGQRVKGARMDCWLYMVKK